MSADIVDPLLELWERRILANAEWDRAGFDTEDAAGEKATAIEVEIVATPATTVAGMLVKARLAQTLLKQQQHKDLAERRHRAAAQAPSLTARTFPQLPRPPRRGLFFAVIFLRPWLCGRTKRCALPSRRPRHHLCHRGGAQAP